MFREGGYHPHPESTTPSPEKKDVLNGIKEELRRWLPRVLLLASVASCGDREDQRAQEFMEQKKEEAMERVSDPSMETQPKIAVVDTASGTVIPSEIKSMIDTIFASPAEPVIAAVPHVQEAEGLTTIHQEATHYHRGHHHDAPENQPSELLSGNVSHPHLEDASRHQHETDAHDPLGEMSDGHPHEHHQENSVNASSPEHAHGQESGHGHYDILTGAKTTDALGKTITEVLDLHGHTEFHIADSEGIITIGLGKGTQRFSGHEGAHISAGISFAEPIYGVVTPGAEIEIGDEGTARLVVSVKSPDAKYLQWWAGVTAGGEGRERPDHDEHQDDEIHPSTSTSVENATPTRFNPAEKADGGHAEEHHKERAGIGIEGVMQHLESGLRSRIGELSSTVGIEHQAAYSRFELPLTIEGRDVTLSLLTRAELGHDQQNVGVFFRIKGQI